MSGNNRNKNKKPTAGKSTQATHAKSAGVKTEVSAGKKSGTEIFLIVFAAVAVVAVVATIIIGLSSIIFKDKRVNYLSDDLSQYIYISPDDYRNITGAITNVDPVDDLDVEAKILSLLCEYKGAVKYDGKYVKNATVSVGDVVYIYYRGYLTNDDGSRNYFDGGCNFSSESPTSLEIGAGGFIPGFEMNMIGKNPKNYSTFTVKSTNGQIPANEKVYISYTRTDSSGASESGTRIIDLSLGKSVVDYEWAVSGTESKIDVIGLYDALVGAEYNKEIKFVASGDYDSNFTVKAYRVLTGNEIVQVTYTGYFYGSDNPLQGQTAIIDLSDPAINKKYGEGFAEFFATGVPVGTKATIVDENGKATTLKTTVGENEQNAFLDITVNAVYDIGDNPMTVKAYFPTDYGQEDLNGKWADFEVFIMKSQEYEASAFDDAFITEKLKYTAESLAEYDGDTLTLKYRDKIYKDLMDDYNDSVNTAIDALLFETLVAKAKVKSLPKLDVRDYYDSYYNSIHSQFSTSYSGYYESVDAFARAQLGLASNADWKAELQKYAETYVTQKLVFYYVLRTEPGLMVPDEEYEALKAELLEDYLEQTLENAKVKRSDYKTEEEYLKKVEEYRKNVEEYYTEASLRESVIYEYAIRNMRAFVKLTDAE